jgi:RNA polymerase sigma-70 factor (ECF subfamily)
MSEDSSFVRLMEQLRAGDPNAQQRIFEAFTHRLIGLARSRMDRMIQQREGPEDVVQSALASFFRRDAVKPFELSNWDNLWALLTVITLRKCGHKIEYYRAACRDVRRDTPSAAGTDDSAESWLRIAREPSPSEVAALRDTMDELLRGLDEREQRIVSLVLEGYTVPEISRTVGRSEYLVRKVVSQIRSRWERLCD